MARRGYFRRPSLATALQHVHMVRRFPQFRATTDHGARMAWRGSLQPTPLSPNYEVQIAYRMPRHPEVRVLAPALKRRGSTEIPHLFADGSLCLCEPGQWNAMTVIADTLVPWAALWLYFYEIWYLTGEWHGGGSHPAAWDSVA
ncbi:MAG: hypothetical protein ACRD4Q_01665 [Candidatus Acidiferrales bacterium]